MSIHAAANGTFFILFMAEYYSIVYLCVCVCVLYSCICQWMFRWLTCLTTVNSAAVNMDVHVSFQIRVFSKVGMLDHIVAIFLVF